MRSAQMMHSRRVRQGTEWRWRTAPRTQRLCRQALHQPQPPRQSWSRGSSCWGKMAPPTGASGTLVPQQQEAAEAPEADKGSPTGAATGDTQVNLSIPWRLAIVAAAALQEPQPEVARQPLRFAAAGERRLQPGWQTRSRRTSCAAASACARSAGRVPYQHVPRWFHRHACSEHVRLLLPVHVLIVVSATAE